MINRLHIDFETFSKSPLKTVGMYRYAEDPSTEVICIAWSMNGEDPHIWTMEDSDEPLGLFDAIEDADEIWAHNAGFEICIWENVCFEKMGWPPLPISKVRDSAALAAYNALPRSLDGCGNALGLDIVKDKRGSHLINKLSKPRKPSKYNPDTRWYPDTARQDFDDFYEYCRQDVRSEAAFHDTGLTPLPEREYETWLLDLRANRRGVSVNQDALNDLIAAREEFKDRAIQDALHLVDGAFQTLNQREKVLDWCKRSGFMLPDLTADSVSNALGEKRLPPAIRTVLKARQIISRTSTKKFDAIFRAVCSDGRLHGMLQFYGASRTGRWAGRILQPQNLPRPTIKEEDISLVLECVASQDYDQLELLFEDPMEALVSCIRALLQPGEGLVFYCGDYSNVEGRGLFWVADDREGLEAFHSGLDLYKVMAADIYDKPYEEVNEDNERRMGKLAILGLGYGMGDAKFIRTGKEKAGIDIPKPFAKKVVGIYRDKRQAVKSFWRETEKMSVRAVSRPGKWFDVNDKISYRKDGDFLKCRLPSGRELHYPFPRIRDMPTPWGEVKPTLTYKSEEKKKWITEKTFGGKLTENIVQALSRDLLREAMFRVEDAGYKIVLTVHDEIVSERKEGPSRDDFLNLMSVLPDWAEGFPLKASGWVGGRFKK